MTSLHLLSACAKKNLHSAGYSYQSTRAMRPSRLSLLLSILAVRNGHGWRLPHHVSLGCRQRHTSSASRYDIGHPSNARSRAVRRHLSPLSMAADGPPPGETKNLGSYYRRPSAAIERGGGFFVPGLQGFRLRLVLAGIILGLVSLEGLPKPGMSGSQIISQALAAQAGFALLVQALLDQQKEQAVQIRRDAIAAASIRTTDEESVTTAEGQISFFDSAVLGGELAGRVRWAADILLQLTAGSFFVAFSDDGKVLARAGSTGGESEDASSLAAAYKRAAEEDQGSSVIITRTGEGEGKGEGGGGGDQIDTATEDTIMRLLPSACRQGILYRVSPVPGGIDMVVLLGSTVGGAGVFSGMDGAWFDRVCAHLAVPAAGQEGGDR